MKLVVGLGNPGREYEKHRHNVGFMAVEQFQGSAGGSAWRAQFDGRTSECHVGGQKVLLLEPLSYMNRSGRAVRQAVDFYKIPPADVLVVCDDFSLPLAAMRFRAEGSSGGQNGLKDIFAHLGTQAVPRLRLGIGDPGPRDPADFVLSPFSAAEQAAVTGLLIDADRAIDCWVREGLQVAMNRFNGKPGGKEKADKPGKGDRVSKTEKGAAAGPGRGAGQGPKAGRSGESSGPATTGQTGQTGQTGRTGETDETKSKE